ncbi:uncharacterized protein LOC142242414 [Haematobia irritans]|uniref:uncharacterized protein LOC142242414 n=1 Tax=Haematobia irritans TaxID=7368 RepID=UPI003F4F703A
MPDNNTSSSSSAVNNSNHEGSDFSQCFKKVDLIGKQLDKINKRLTNEELQSLDEADLSVRLDYIESLNASFEGSISTLEEAHGDNLDESIRSNFMASYFEVKAKLKRKIDGSNHARISPQSSTFRQFSMEEPRTIRKTRLPELKIPDFNGSYTDWPNFFSMFTTVIDNDLDLTNIEKFQHLRSLLVGAALDTISSLEPIDSNYNKALELLKNRFDNKLLLFQSHIKDIFGLKIADKGSAVSLRQLSDKLNAHVRALETVCTKEQLADGLLINIVVSKLDHQTQTKWEEGLQNDKLPTWNSMASFLERRSRMLENLESSMKSTASNQHSNKKPPMHGRNVLIASGSKSVFCTYCETDDHYISSCSRFTNLHPTLRFKEVKRLNLCLNCLRKGHRLQKCKFGPCRTCHMKHHSLLHIENNLGSQTTTSQIDNMPPQQPTTSQLSPPLSQPNQVTSQSSLVSLNPSPSNIEFNDGSNILLATAIVLVKNKNGNFVPCRAILDSASQLNFMTTRFVNQAQLNMKNANIAISGIGEGNITADKTTEVLIKSCHSDYCVSFVAVIIPSITEYQPNRDIDVSTFEIPNNIKLADANFYERGRIDLLIGAGLFFDLMSVGQIRCKNNSTIFQKTRLGWVVSGGCVSKSNGCSLAASSKGLSKGETQSLAHIMKSFWEVEQNYGNNSHPNSDDAYCEQHFIKNTIRLPSGEYSVSLPRKLNFNELGDSYSCALRRFLNLERKLNKLPAVKKKYVDFMSEYAELKHMTLVTDIPKHIKTCFLPHHCVHKEESTSTKLRVVFDGSAKTTTGLSLNDTLHSGPTIQAKLFDTLLRFRFFKIALCGDICKMYRCIRINSPDDYLQCILWRNSSDEEIKIYKLNTVTYGTKPAAFLAIRAMHQLSYDERESYPIGATVVTRDFYVDDLISGGDSIDEVVKIRREVTAILKRGNLQIRKWISNDETVLQDVCQSDRETFLQFHDGTDVTKTLGLVWDPKLGKFLFSLSHVMESKNISKRTVLSSIARLYDPLGLIGPVTTKAKIFMQSLWKRTLDWDESLPQDLHYSTVQIHAFCDASLSAYGVCIYIRSEYKGEVRVSLLCSKSRVAPLKVLTVPKLELSAALLLAEILDEVSGVIGNKYECHCWSDSMVVLSWLRDESSNYNVFVSNRVSRIQTLTQTMSWHHVPTAQNPADILSRGSSPEELVNCELWKNGPAFLNKSVEHWPKITNFISDLPERRRAALISSTMRDFAMTFNFAAEYKALKSNQNVPPSSKLYSLAPFMDSDGLIRVGGRLQNSYLNFDAQHPIIVPKQHPLTTSMVMYYHEKLLHAGPQCLLANIRQQYWPLGGRKTISIIASKCIKCFRLKPKITEHVMGSLPHDRVQPSRAFFVTGIDFCGPFYYKSGIRNRSPLKCYICIFICFSTKATHMERQTKNYNFVGAKNELKELRQLFFEQNNIKEIEKQCLADEINWKFIPPRSPHFGGLWEAAVKSAKYHFYRTVGQSVLTFDELRTLACEICAVLNSRPLCQISEDPNDLEVLTPGHFLVGAPLITFSEPDVTDLNVCRLTRWQRVCYMQQIFWKKWSSSYLALLQERTKWISNQKNISIGNMVLIKEDNLPPLKWLLGRVVDVVSGGDGVVRVALIKTLNGIIRRSVTKLALLPIDDNFVAMHSIPTGGGCSGQPIVQADETQ